MDNRRFNTDDFDFSLAKECAQAFSVSTGLGCVVSDNSGNIIGEYGYGCASCKICELGGFSKTRCNRSQVYGMIEAERFGGKYIYFCPMGLTCFVSPIVGIAGSCAKITVGPFLMVDQTDYIACDLEEALGDNKPLRFLVIKELMQIPVAPPDRVSSLSTLLFMSVGFMNNVSAANRMLETQYSDAIQGQITSYIMQLKGGNHASPYPFETERALMKAIARSDKSEAQKLLNELFGYIFFSTGRNFEIAKSRICELLVLMSRTAAESGADPEHSLSLTHSYLQKMSSFQNLDELCFWISGVMNDFMDSIFNLTDAKHADVIHKTIRFIRENYAEKITLDETAKRMYLSPAYFSRIFKEETGTSFNTYLNNVRIEKSKELLKSGNTRLTDIALMVGFEDQSYFTKVFKRTTGISPLKYKTGHKN